jgi:hypothetical protein
MFMIKTAVILLSFLAYSLTLVHSVVPHHHHDKQVSDHHHENSDDHHHHDNADHEEKSVSHAFADAIHFPGSEIAIPAKQSLTIEKVVIIDLQVDNLVSFLLPQLKPPDVNADRRQAHYSSRHQSFFLLRGPPVM